MSSNEIKHEINIGDPNGEVNKTDDMQKCVRRIAFHKKTEGKEESKRAKKESYIVRINHANNLNISHKCGMYFMAVT